ncbi:MAG: TlyA family RNA methyltransferase [bacterium]
MKISDYLIHKQLTKDYKASFAVIVGGLVYVNGEKETSMNRSVSDTDLIKIIKRRKYVSRSGEKLEAAIKYFNISAYRMVCLDAGASTGGFTDCLLQHGAARIYAVDVGYGKLDWKLRNNPLIVNLERQNVREMLDVIDAETIDLITLDISFSSVKTIIPEVLPLLKPRRKILVMVKPQFELSKNCLRKGIVIEKADQEKAVASVITSMKKQGLSCSDAFASPVKGTKGNQEYFILGSL